MFVADGAVEEHQALFSRPTSTDTVSNESKQNMVEIEQELLQRDVKLDFVAAVWAWVCGRGGAMRSTVGARADHLKH